jgi:hypothetical protein
VLARQLSHPLERVETGNLASVDRDAVLGWHQVAVGLRSSSAQRRLGRWVHREDWTWLVSEEAARRYMAKQAKTGHVPGLALLWMPVLGVPGKIVALGPAAHPAFREMQWRVYRSMLVSDLPGEAGLDYLFMQEYVRAPTKGEASRDSWRHWVLSQ